MDVVSGGGFGGVVPFKFCIIFIIFGDRSDRVLCLMWDIGYASIFVTRNEDSMQIFSLESYYEIFLVLLRIWYEDNLRFAV